jgi:hypothetical protein
MFSKCFGWKYLSKCEFIQKVIVCSDVNDAQLNKCFHDQDWVGFNFYQKKQNNFSVNEH